MNAIGGLDIGTTGSKISLYDEKARLLVSYYTEYVAFCRWICYTEITKLRRYIYDYP